jgi:hypothetical protein
MEGGGGAGGSIGRGGGGFSTGLSVRLLPPGHDIVTTDAPLLPLLGPDPDGGGGAKSSQQRRRPLHWAVAGLILFGFSAPAALVTVPFAMGTAGLLLGFVALVVLTAASVGGALMLLEIYVAHPWCQNMPELGEAAMVRVRVNAGGCGVCRLID